MLEGLYSITPGPFIFKAKKEFQEMYSIHFYPLKLADFIRELSQEKEGSHH